MPKAEKGSIKYLANRMKSKGLQKLRWYCQMCQKQCRDENGFKCHTMSESHQRQLLLFADQPNKFLADYSKDFEKGFMNLLKRSHGTKRVFANMVYQNYIKEKDHIHMNATRWETLSGFVQYLGKSGQCIVDRQEKGWYITWIDRDPETIARQEALAKKDKVAKDDEERLAQFISKQVEKGSNGAAESVESQATDLIRVDEDEKVTLSFSSMSDKKPNLSTLKDVKPVMKVPIKSADSSSNKLKRSDEPSDGKRKKSALDEIMESELAQKKKRVEEESAFAKADLDSSERPWLKKGIVVKIVTKSLGEKYYKAKGHIKEVVGDDRMAAVVVLNNGGGKVKLDQSHLETVVPAPDRSVLVLMGKHRGEEAVLKSLDVEKFCAKLKLVETGEKISLPYEHFSKLHSA